MTRAQWVRRQRLAVAVTVILTLLLGGLGALVVRQSMLMAEHDAARDVAFNHAQRIVQRLQEAVGPSFMLASLVQQGGGRVDNFDAIGEGLLHEFPMARAVELAPDGIISQVYPLAGNEPIIGHDLLKDKNRNLEAHTALTTRELTLAGPFDLIQGGVGVVGRYPVYLADRTGRTAFWGFSIVLIRVPDLLKAAGLGGLAGYRYELCRMPPKGGDCVLFARSSEGPLGDRVSVPVNTLHAHWVLSIAPEGGWITGSSSIVQAIAVLALATLMGGLQYWFLFRLQRSLALQESDPSEAAGAT